MSELFCGRFAFCFRNERFDIFSEHVALCHQLLRRRDSNSVQRLVAALAEPFRETLVLREIQNLSYRQIAEVVGAPVGTVMSRLARARSMLRAAWMAEEEQPQ